MTRRNPHRRDAGFVAGRESQHPALPGHFVVYDREADPPPDIDADDRWVVMHNPSSAMLSCRTKGLALDVMVAMSEGSNDYDFGQHKAGAT